jgi:hypothetical protein
MIVSHVPNSRRLLIVSPLDVSSSGPKEALVRASNRKRDQPKHGCRHTRESHVQGLVKELSLCYTGTLEP